MTASELLVREVAPEDLHALRRRVLRGDNPQSTVSDERDHGPDALHLGAFCDDVLISCGSFYPCAAPIHPELASVQLRYLATESTRQGSGVGRLLMRAAESRLASRGVEQMWANGRDTALGFYRRVGWRTIPGSEHLSGETQLPHTVIYKVVRRTDPVEVGWATPADAVALAQLREEMFFSIALQEFGDAWVRSSSTYFAEELAVGSLCAAVARTGDGEVVALAAATLRRIAPTPRVVAGRTAYVHSVSTLPGFRRRGLSRQLVVAVIDEVRRRGVERVELHATDQGESLYRDLGFVVRAHSPEMRLTLVEQADDGDLPSVRRETGRTSHRTRGSTAPPASPS